MKLTKETLESIIQEELEDLFEEEEELEEEKRPWWDLGYGAGPESDDPRQAAGQPYSKEDPSGDLEGWGSGVISKAPGYFIQKDAERRGRNVGIGSRKGVGGNIAPHRERGKYDKKPVKRTRRKPRPFKKSYIPKWED